jgi:nitrite reductase/ring-hydroxylating ferredoxin subunit
MPATQPDPLDFNPNHLPLTRLGCYERTIDAPVERVWENVLDWEHLPHLHDTSFNYCELDQAGTWGWRTWTNASHTANVELIVDQDKYVARSYRHGEQQSEIWTRLTPNDDRTDIEVTFYAANVDEQRRSQLSDTYLALYRQLWDEDEAMMMARQRRLSGEKSTHTELNLGPRASLTLPLVVSIKGGEFCLVQRDSALRIHPTICPHLLGPLSMADDGLLHCPWHGFRFNPESGECVEPARATCRLPKAPAIKELSGNIILSYR